MGETGGVSEAYTDSDTNQKEQRGVVQTGHPTTGASLRVGELLRQRTDPRRPRGDAQDKAQ